MDYPEVVGQIAPCGLNCGTCCAHQGGPVQQSAKALADGLGTNFAVYAARFAAMNPVFENYAAFDELLQFFAGGSCGNCREKGCLFQDCQVTRCAKDRNVEFCFMCKEYPCDHHGLPEGLAARWKANNDHMKKVGLVDYYNKIKDKPRYP